MIVPLDILGLESTVVTSTGGRLHLEEHKLHQTGVTLHSVAVVIVDHQQSLGTSVVSCVPDRSVNSYSAAEQAGTRAAKSHDIQRQMHYLIEDD